MAQVPSYASCKCHDLSGKCQPMGGGSALVEVLSLSKCMVAEREAFQNVPSYLSYPYYINKINILGRILSHLVS